jgi:hypothetical protein
MHTSKTDADWQRSSFCANSGCVEVGRLSGGGIGVRDSKAEGLVLAITTDDFQAFIRGVKAGEFDHYAREGAASQPAHI